MPMAFVLINAEIGSEDAVVKELKAVSNVKEAYMVYGVYDIVAKVAADSMDKLKEIITWKIRRLNKVKSTLTMIVIENYPTNVNPQPLDSLASTNMLTELHIGIDDTD